MHHHTVTLKSPFSIQHLHSYNRHHHVLLLKPRLTFPSAPSRYAASATGGFSCKGVIHQLSPPNHGGSVLNDWKLRSVGVKSIDVATLGNLCVDVVLNVPKLPPSSPLARKAYMENLSSSPPDNKHWEAGGNCNMVIAAARLEFGCAAIGHVGDEIYSQFLIDVLRDEGISMVGMTEDGGYADIGGDGYSRESYETLLCWVLVDPLQRHGFCSWMSNLTSEVKMSIARSRILFCNGYGFDEFSPGLIVSALYHAIEVGTSVFFDHGPWGKSLSSGTPEQKEALTQFLKMSDVLLLTKDEVHPGIIF